MGTLDDGLKRTKIQKNSDDTVYSFWIMFMHQILFLLTGCSIGFLLNALPTYTYEHFRYTGENGVSRIEDGYLKNPDSEKPIQVVKGSYSYIGPDDKVSKM